MPSARMTATAVCVMFMGSPHNAQFIGGLSAGMIVVESSAMVAVSGVLSCNAICALDHPSAHTSAAPSNPPTARRDADRTRGCRCGDCRTGVDFARNRTTFPGLPRERSRHRDSDLATCATFGELRADTYGPAPTARADGTTGVFRGSEAMQTDADGEARRQRSR